MLLKMIPITNDESLCHIHYSCVYISTCDVYADTYNLRRFLTEASFNKHNGRPQWTNNMGGWSVARSDSPLCLLKQAPGLLAISICMSTCIRGGVVHGELPMKVYRLYTQRKHDSQHYLMV